MFCGQRVGQFKDRQPERGSETERGAQLSQYAATSSATKGSSITASKISSLANQEGRVGKLWGSGRKVPYLCVVR